MSKFSGTSIGDRASKAKLLIRNNGGINANCTSNEILSFHWRTLSRKVKTVPAMKNQFRISEKIV